MDLEKIIEIAAKARTEGSKLTPKQRLEYQECALNRIYGKNPNPDGGGEILPMNPGEIENWAKGILPKLEQPQKCLHDMLDENSGGKLKIHMISCPCPKCTPTCLC